MTRDYTPTEHAAGLSAALDAYPDEPRMSKADLAAEAEWWAGFKARTDEPGWGEDATRRVLESLHREREKRRAWEADHTCQGCGFVPAETVCSHGKCICEGCCASTPYTRMCFDIGSAAHKLVLGIVAALARKPLLRHVFPIGAAIDASIREGA